VRETLLGSQRLVGLGFSELRILKSPIEPSPTINARCVVEVQITLSSRNMSIHAYKRRIFKVGLEYREGDSGIHPVLVSNGIREKGNYSTQACAHECICIETVERTARGASSPSRYVVGGINRVQDAR